MILALHLMRSRDVLQVMKARHELTKLKDNACISKFLLPVPPISSGSRTLPRTLHASDSTCLGFYVPRILRLVLAAVTSKLSHGISDRPPVNKGAVSPSRTA
jgi:hypothetical protein